MPSSIVRSILTSPMLSVLKTSASASALLHARKHNTGTIPVTSPPKAPATIPLTNKKKLPVSKQHKETVKKQIQRIYDKSNQNYGASKITRELRKSSIRIAERTVGTYMREMGIKAQWVKPWITTTRNSDFSNKLHNILNEQFNPERPDAVWCTDITYIWTHDGFVYLTSIMDLYARKIIARTLSDSMEVSCVIDTINKAKARRFTNLPHIY